jgi:hypothetical protein
VINYDTHLRKFAQKISTNREGRPSIFGNIGNDAILTLKHVETCLSSKCLNGNVPGGNGPLSERRKHYTPRKTRDITIREYVYANKNKDKGL